MRTRKPGGKRPAMPTIAEATSHPKATLCREDERRISQSIQQERTTGTAPAVYIELPSPNPPRTAQIPHGGTLVLDFGGMLTEQSFTFTDDDGTEWTWAVTQARKYAASIREVALFTWGDYGIDEAMVLRQYPDLDKEYAMTTDLTNPVLLVLFQGALLCVDGWHRLWKAIVTGVPTIPALLLFADEAERFLISCLTPDGQVHWGPLMAGRVFQIETEPPAELVMGTTAETMPRQSYAAAPPLTAFYVCCADGKPGGQ